jgi:hypothetical protein
MRDCKQAARLLQVCEERVGEAGGWLMQEEGGTARERRRRLGDRLSQCCDPHDARNIITKPFSVVDMLQRV